MSQNKNFTLNLPGAETEITLPIEKVEELMKVMNMMDKKGFSEEETRRIVIEEFCKFKQKIEEENQIRGRNQQSGDGTSVRYGPSAKVKSLPSVVVSKKSVMPTARRTSSKVVLEDIEVKKMCESSRYPIYVTADDIVTIYPSYMVERFLKTAQLSKKKTVSIYLIYLVH
ncbi:hypothetical protein O3M35_011783 [Rhynocoris fuscipes]|uniref:Uncharacterized protein n=1 Tax=Rhynocoris fuscipes TaxID=488301 RepID=A0AAW1D053_9HEMI